LKVKYYIRYVDDFVILHEDENVLNEYKNRINEFLRERLFLELHPQKCKITQMGRNITFLGFRIFDHHKLLRKSNMRKMMRKFEWLKRKHAIGVISYDAVYDYFQGWMAYASHANTYKLRRRLTEEIEEHFPGEVSIVELNRLEKLLWLSSQKVLDEHFACFV
jgi:hypothetical protein